MDGTSLSARVRALDQDSFVLLVGPFARPYEAWTAARLVVDAMSAGDAPLVIIGDYVVPPADGPASRDFQTLHFDFGLPLVPVVPADVARFTALYVPSEVESSDAVTRLVPVRSLFAARAWPEPAELVRRFTAYGDSRGAWDSAVGYCEGSLARIVEAALGDVPVLPSVKEEPDFLCGAEFNSVIDELLFFSERGLEVDTVAIDACLRPGQLLVFDNLVLAHGRHGVRQPGELHQRVFGHRSLPAQRQIEIRDRLLHAFR